MKKHLRFISLALIVPIMLTSCATILNGKQQKVRIHTHSSDSKVFVNGEEAGTGKTVTTKLPRDGRVQQVKIEREGYKDIYEIYHQTNISPLHYLSWGFVIMYYIPALDAASSKTRDYKRDLYVKKKDQSITNRGENEKYVYVKHTAFDVDEEDFKFNLVKKKHFKKKKTKKYKEIETNDEKIEFDNSIFTSTLNDILVKYHYTDTTGTILKKRGNSKYINATIEKIEFKKIYDRLGKFTPRYLMSDVTIKWELTDIYEQVQYEKSVKGTSGDFKFTEDVALSCLNDAITASFLDFIDDKKVRDLLDKGNDEEIKFEYIALTKGKAPKTIEEAMGSSVTIKTDLGHGSGLAVSTDGYIVTNLHVVANAEKVEVITNQGETLKATVVRQNGDKDLALLKIEHNFNNTFTLTSEKNYSIGQEIYAIGTPKSIELGQSLSRGIISGIRTNEGENYIQTDASVNGGNSGGPLIGKSGELIGVVNAKLQGFGVEGIGFVIPAWEIEKALFLK
ncbi:S1C family serine protease [Mangrovimonas aestuarii]|uniref:S1C family serine protease n=1 Tax=Mangrovimonas aestuarii TaxID=3018443 RepID=UPI00237909FC|nr:S1C family serine protease [Mangrovimonas aestuarii]